jgi:ATP-dependent Lon protease
MVSALTGRLVHREVAMTGEITLRGRVLPIGGLKEKIMAAHRAGISTVILPRRNKNDLTEVPKDVQRGVQFVFVDDMAQVLPAALGEKVVAETLASKAAAEPKVKGESQTESGALPTAEPGVAQP